MGLFIGNASISNKNFIRSPVQCLPVLSYHTIIDIRMDF